MPEHPPTPSDSATWTASAPGRVNIIGEHVDYNHGWVLPMALEQCVTLTASPLTEPIAVFQSGLSDETVRLDLSNPGKQETPAWGNYVQGVVWEFLQETGAALPGFTATVTSEVPLGAGLSSSAALEVATATLLEKITGHTLRPLDKARLCQQVEHTYAGVPCGLMDQAASTLCKAGHLLLFDCVTEELRHVPFSDDSIVVLIANTGVSHALCDGEYAKRRGQCEEALEMLGKTSFREVSQDDLEAGTCPLSDVHIRRVRHVITENDRTLATVAALELGDWDTVGEHLYASHDSLAKDYEVSCPELDGLVESARALGRTGGVIGARMTGGGFGGCTITLVRQPNLGSVQEHLATRYRKRFGGEPTFYTARPAQGAR
jgi:galactokinase